MRLGFAVDHGGFPLKELLVPFLSDLGHEMTDFGASLPDPEDDYPDFVVPLAKSIATGEIDRGIIVCGVGIGGCIAANKIPGVRAGLGHDPFTVRLGVEHDDMNLLVIGARMVGPEMATEIIRVFLESRFQGKPRYVRRLERLKALEARGGELEPEEENGD